MKVSVTREICLFEVDEDFVLRPKVLVNCLQQAAALHSQQAGYATPDMLKQQKAWVLYRLALQIYNQPVFGAPLEIVTWHKGTRGFRSYRDFEIYQAGRKSVSAASLWLYIDLARKKILKVPGDVAQSYTVEPDNALDAGLDRWKPAAIHEPDIMRSIGTRPSDYDPLGHVNNAMYFDYLETMAAPVFENHRKIGSISIQYNREIPGQTPEICAALKKGENGFTFEIRSPADVHAAGEFVLHPRK
ncbi:MAG: acyl-[acyl-carrier-protein] thioesterase [Desulfosalsimonas sp.]